MTICGCRTPAARYITATGDTGVLDREARRSSRAAPRQLEGEDSYYDLPVRSQESAALYDHCVRAIEHGYHLGEHGLPLMGTGDWNDGMNLVGDEGKGEERVARSCTSSRCCACCSS